MITSSKKKILGICIQCGHRRIAAADSGLPRDAVDRAAGFGSERRECHSAGRIGSIKAISGGVITLTPDSGPEIQVTVQAGARIVRIAPGEKTLKNATPVELQELQAGDRILVAGKASDDAKTITAASIVVMKRSDVEARKEEDRQDWQKRGTRRAGESGGSRGGDCHYFCHRLRRRQDHCCPYF